MYCILYTDTLHLVQRGGDWVGPQPTQALLAIANTTAHPSTASVSISENSACSLVARGQKWE